jgi:hypothetical protein
MTFTFHAFHPKALMIIITGRSSGLLPAEYLPVPPFRNSGLKIPQLNNSSQLTATGIAPDLHRTSHFNGASAPTNYAGKCIEVIYFTKFFIEEQRKMKAV